MEDNWREGKKIRTWLTQTVFKPRLPTVTALEIPFARAAKWRDYGVEGWR